jgi:hypothetical protein
MPVAVGSRSITGRRGRNSRRRSGRRRPVRPDRRSRARDFDEHGDEILGSIGLDPEAIFDLEVRGVVG